MVLFFAQCSSCQLKKLWQWGKTLTPVDTDTPHKPFGIVTHPTNGMSVVRRVNRLAP
jgi:hypothetical protein